jgi:hypothetical protein
MYVSHMSLFAIFTYLCGTNVDYLRKQPISTADTVTHLTVTQCLQQDSTRSDTEDKLVFICVMRVQVRYRQTFRFIELNFYYNA